MSKTNMSNSVHSKLHQRIPVTVIAGFLGAGKTTLVNGLIQRSSKRFGVIVNEFGDLGIDGALIENLNETGVTELSSGCLCCVGRDDLIVALVKLGQHPRPPEHILLELSGLADPVPVLQTLLDPQVKAVFEIDGLVTVIDARNFYSTLEQNPEAASQLAYANSVILNKADLCDTELLEDVQKTTRELSPLASISVACRGDAPLERMLELRAFDPNFRPEHHPHQHTPNVSSFALEADRPLDLVRWQWFLQEMILEKPNQVLRVKGWLALDGMLERLLFQSVRDIFSAELTTQRALGRSSLVVIGRNLDKEAYRERFELCKVAQ
jgi:G3E family GTPase